jgi:hypothetical protein
MNHTKIDEMLVQHQLWLQTGGEKGTRANFRDVNCEDANFQNANLERAIFVDADCCAANFQNANLERAIFVDADCCAANFQNANCMYTDFTRADLGLASFRDVHCLSTIFERSLCECTNFSSANLTNANFKDAKCRGAIFNYALLKNINFTNTILPHYEIFPVEGSFVAWVVLPNGCIAKVEVPADAKRKSYLNSREGKVDQIKMLKCCTESKSRMKCSFDESCESCAFLIRDYKEDLVFDLTSNAYLPTLISEDKIGFRIYLTKEEAMEANL